MRDWSLIEPYPCFIDGVGAVIGGTDFIYKEKQT